jgi:hypothetical protein
VINLATSRSIPFQHHVRYQKSQDPLVRKGIQVKDVSFFVSGALFLPYFTAIASHIWLVPGFNPAIADLQLASATAGVWVRMISATFMLLPDFRAYSYELIQLLNDGM